MLYHVLPWHKTNAKLNNGPRRCVCADGREMTSKAPEGAPRSATGAHCYTNLLLTSIIVKCDPCEVNLPHGG